MLAAETLKVVQLNLGSMLTHQAPALQTGGLPGGPKASKTKTGLGRRHLRLTIQPQETISVKIAIES